MAETDTEGSAMTSTQIPAIRTYEVSNIDVGLTAGATTQFPNDHIVVIMVPLEEIAKMVPELASVDPTRIVSFPKVRVSSQSATFYTATATLTRGQYADDYDVVITSYSTAVIGMNTSLYVNLTIAVLQ